MIVTLNLNPDVEKGLAARAWECGVSVDDYVQQIVTREALVSNSPQEASGQVLNLPILHLGMMDALHRSDIYSDVR